MDLVQFGKIERDWYAAYNAVLAPINAPIGSLLGKDRPAKPVAGRRSRLAMPARMRMIISDRRR